MSENEFNQFSGQSGQPESAGGQGSQANVPPVQPDMQQGQPQQTPVYGYYAQQPNMQQTTGGQQEPSFGEAPREQKKKRKFPKVLVSAVAGIVAGGLLTAFVIMPAVTGANLPVQQLPTKEEQTQEQGTGEAPSLGGEAQGIRNTQNPAVEIAENISGSVVGITAYNKQLVSGQEPVEQALDAGTGFVISEAEGYILTNNHVIADGNLIKVTTPDGQEHIAEKVGGDSSSDIAVIKVENLGIKAVPIGDSDSVKAGELAVAIGNVRGETFNNSVTVGHVSIAQKEIALDGNKMQMIQTDAAINAGNSGGPLVGEDGKVIGVNTAKKYYSGMDANGNLLTSEGVGYAIPINKAIDTAQQLIENGSIPRAGIGITYSLISDVDARLWDTPRGALVVDVTAGGPADQAGLQQNDVITEIDGVDLTAGADMPVLSQKEVGEKVTAKVWREGQEYSVEFTLADMNNIG
ncbi:S1C family serine protease [Christensenella tenuis]|uniref:Trypsin-like peptidase domain-containing protein n=1 Tax=Christensenella tenuis TaxID=2763033 RepID=A0ABR7EHN1_9FIRM|nr:trypsin-like peptidase domain-containing protein [Christensenella tenuis]MBC5649291.1 trypsin-like peptidase domain-containing protein [Christensenella tenuis]